MNCRPISILLNIKYSHQTCHDRSLKKILLKTAIAFCQFYLSIKSWTLIECGNFYVFINIMRFVKAALSFSEKFRFLLQNRCGLFNVLLSFSTFFFVSHWCHVVGDILSSFEFLGCYFGMNRLVTIFKCISPVWLLGKKKKVLLNKAIRDFPLFSDQRG